ncbi:hypothetical protein AMATHDRAFT_66576 [Amanita thiersii Skay4041]|uniref:DUF6533 domain-containing protein n=1 Tax=Amanita thiersii Skay4041 TaxID=703135 RepID=A0A2A9NA53_9AGAR|nr:hypothetical protein AMATHDRAFT_66576 [Amanita thiersii Skay4041]
MTAGPFFDLIQSLGDLQSTRYAELASSCIIVYDHLITLDREIDLIWMSPWSTGKVLFILNRYYTLTSVLINNYGLFGSHLTNSICSHFYPWQGWTGLIACILAEAILQMRIYALYYLNKRLLVVMVTLFVACMASSAYVMGSVLSNIDAIAVNFSGWHVCLPLNVSSHFYAFWIPILFFETFLCILAIYRGFQTFKTDGSLFQSGRRLVGILIRDSVMYFIVMCATYLTNLLVWVLARQTLLEIPIGFSVAFSCVLANRVVLNVRHINRENSTEHRRVSRIRIESNHTRDAVYRVQANSRLNEIEMACLRSLRAPNV